MQTRDVRRQRAYLARRLNERFGNHPFVGNMRGRGLLQAVELTADRGSRSIRAEARRTGEARSGWRAA